MLIIILVQCLSFQAWVWAEGHFNWCLWRVAVIVRFVFPGCIITEFVSHQSAASWRLALGVWVGDVSIHRMFFPLVWRNESSANNSLLTLSFDICSGRSLVKMQNRSGPSTEPWKTLNFTSSFDDDSFIRRFFLLCPVCQTGSKRRWVMKTLWHRAVSYTHLTLPTMAVV